MMVRNEANKNLCRPSIKQFITFCKINFHGILLGHKFVRYQTYEKQNINCLKDFLI